MPTEGLSGRNGRKFSEKYLKSAFLGLGSLAHFLVSPAIDQVVIHKSASLHVGINHRTPHKFEPSFEEVFAKLV